MTAQIHPFPLSPRASGPRYGQVAGSEDFPAACSSLSTSGVRQHTSASKLAAPAFFSVLQRLGDAQQDHSHVLILVTEARSNFQKGRNLVTRTEQIRRASIGVELSSADLLDRCVHLLNSLCDAPNNGDITWNSLSSKSPASFGPEMTEKFFQ